MPSISMKGRQMPSSPIRKLVPYSDEAKRKGRKVYHLNIGQPDIETPKNVRDRIKQIDLEVIEYSHSAGILSYRERLLDYYSSVGIKLDVNDIIVTTGGSEAIIFGMLSCLDNGDEVIIPEPFYANYNGFANITGCVIKPIVSKIENSFALPPIEEFEKLITSKTKAILICNPNNPTGYLYSKSELEKLKDIVRKHNLFLFTDEVYREFCYDGNIHYSAMNLEGIEENVVMFDSVSKRYSACGIRIGCLVSRNKEVIKTAMKYAQARLSPPTLGQLAAEEAINTPRAYFEKVIKEYKERRDIVVESINKIKGCYCPKPAGAFYAVAKLPIDNSDKFCQWLLEEFEYNNETVMFAPATGFYSTHGLGVDEIRISYVLNQESLKRSMVCLAEALKVYPGRK